MTLRIKSVHCPDPHREGEYGWSAIVGQTFNDLRQGKVTKILRDEEVLGTYGIVWYLIYCTNDAGEEVLVAQFNATQVEAVTYFTEGKDY